MREAGEGGGGCSSACEKGVESVGCLREAAPAGAPGGGGERGRWRNGALRMAVVLGLLFPCWPASSLTKTI